MPRESRFDKQNKEEKRIKNLGYLVFFAHDHYSKKHYDDYIDLIPVSWFIVHKFAINNSSMRYQFWRLEEESKKVYIEGYKNWYREFYENLNPRVVRREGFKPELTQKELERYSGSVDIEILGYYPTLIEADIARVNFIKKKNTVYKGLNILDDIYGEDDYIEGKGYVIYAHISPNGKYYIGITKRDPPELRWDEGRGYKKQRKFWNAIKYYGWDNFQHIILETGLSKKMAEYKETKYIEKYNSVENGYNVIYENGEQWEN